VASAVVICPGFTGGGGDSVAALARLALDAVDHPSPGGGLPEFVEGRDLPSGRAPRTTDMTAAADRRRELEDAQDTPSSHPGPKLVPLAAADAERRGRICPRSALRSVQFC
jgi:hypothetical protein